MKLIFCIIVSLFAANVLHAQTAIAPTTTVTALSKMNAGLYSFWNGTDSMYFRKDTSASVLKVKIVHDTLFLPKICPIIIPRNLVGLSVNKFGQAIATYDDGTTSNFLLKNSILIQ